MHRNNNSPEDRHAFVIIIRTIIRHHTPHTHTHAPTPCRQPTRIATLKTKLIAILSSIDLLFHHFSYTRSAEKFRYILIQIQSHFMQYHEQIYEYETICRTSYVLG